MRFIILFHAKSLNSSVLFFTYRTSQLRLAIFLVLNGHMWLVATTVDSTGPLYYLIFFTFL